MNLIGSRSILIANVCALIVASVVVAEGAYIVHECRGYYRPQDAWAFFAAAGVMFVVRNRTFSYVFLFLYVALAILMFVQVQRVHVFAAACGGRLSDPLDYLAPVFFVPLFCLLIYMAVVLVRWAISQFNSKTR